MREAGSVHWPNFKTRVDASGSASLRKFNVIGGRM
jgi:hypothetical protein